MFLYQVPKRLVVAILFIIVYPHKHGPNVHCIHLSLTKPKYFFNQIKVSKWFSFCKWHEVLKLCFHMSSLLPPFPVSMHFTLFHCTFPDLLLVPFPHYLDQTDGPHSMPLLLKGGESEIVDDLSSLLLNILSCCLLGRTQLPGKYWHK